MINCIYILKRGKNKDNKCDKKCINGKSYCKTHIVHDINSDNVNILPNDILNIIIDKFIEMKPDIKFYMAVACSNKELYNLMNDEIKYKCLLLEKEIDIDIKSKNLLYKDQLKLYDMIGCELCKSARIRKVYAEYGIRCCTSCLYENTINEYILVNEYLFEANVFNGCKFRMTKMYNPHGRAYNREYTAKFYWKPDVLHAIKEQYNVDSLEDYKYRKTYELKELKIKEIEKYLSDKKSNLSLSDIDRLTDFTKDCASGYVKNIETYYKDANKLRKEELKDEFIKSQKDYDEFPYKNNIKYTTCYVNMGRRKEWTDNEWFKIKTEAEEMFKRSERHDKINKLSENSAKIKIINIENFNLEELEKVLTTVCHRDGMKCKFCNNNKNYKWPGIVDHHRCKHKDIAMRFILE